ncbi:MAG TPA: Gfo/Idh/MocA family oxidoreductase [Chthonomonadaceae bacterium]|nr:Gfo/Idh/MocA family oxidoreductase [Chthonomonadaceae bacterium]
MLNLAVVGCGNMASDLARRSVKLGRARIAAIHDIDPEVLARRCAEFDAEPESDIHALAKRADIDAFLVGSPPLYHHDNVLALAPAGKPIYCEKPLCTTVQLCDEMIAACREHGVKLFVGQVLRLFPLFWKSYEVIASGELGTPQVLSITRAGQARHHAAGWRASLVESGGLLLEVNSHELDYMLFLMGEVESVYARGRNLNGWADFDDALLVQLNFKNGGIGMLHSSNSSPVGEYRVHIQCTQGNLLHGGFGGELRYRSFQAAEPTVITLQDLADRPNPYDWELTSFFDWCQDDTPPFFTGETGRANVVVAETIYRALASGQVEPVTK